MEYLYNEVSKWNISRGDLGLIIMNKEITDKYIMETKEVVVKKNKSAPIEYKKTEKTYTEDEVKEMIKQVLKEVENEVKE